MRPADALSLLLCSTLVVLSFLWAWAPAAGATEALVHLDDGRVLRLDLARAGTHRIHGPLGDTLIEVRDGRARISASPCPQQRCVARGWITEPGDASVCLPNHVALSIPGTPAGFDAVNH